MAAFILASSSALVLQGCKKPADDDEAVNQEVGDLSVQYRDCLLTQAVALDDGIQPVETIANAAEAGCFPMWSNLSTKVRRTGRETVQEAGGDMAVAEDMIRAFESDLVRVKAIMRDDAIGHVMKQRKLNAEKK
jgi:hypothetical protein